jgi:hypothetical protein
MPPETDPTILKLSLSLLKWIGATSIASFLTLYAAWLSFPPELIIEAVVDKSKKFNSESKIKIKNNGRLPALSIKADAENLCAQIGGIQMKNCGIYNSHSVIGRLSYGETSEISVRPGIGMNQGMHISEFSYTLILKHHAKLFFLKKQISKTWRVALHNYSDGYSWDITIV